MTAEKIIEDYKDNFSNFLKDLGERHTAGSVLAVAERINVIDRRFYTRMMNKTYNNLDLFIVIRIADKLKIDYTDILNYKKDEDYIRLIENSKLMDLKQIPSKR